MRNLRNIAIAAVLIFAMVAMTGCTTFNNFKAAFFEETGLKSDTIKIGVLEPQTGNDSKMGNEEIRGIELAHKLKPNVLDKDVELIFEDTQSSIYVTETAVTDLIAKAPAVVLGSYGDTVTLIASQMLGEAKIPAIAITSTNPLITVNNPYYFRVSFTDASQGKVLADYVVEKLKLKKAAVIRMDRDDTTVELVSKFKSRMRHLTGTESSVPLTIDVKVDTKDYTEMLEQIRDSEVKAVFMPVNLTVAQAIMEQADKLEMTDITFIGPKDWHGDEMLLFAKKHPNLSISVASDFVSTVEDEENKENQDVETTSVYEEFVEAYQAEYTGAEPTEAAALAFDAYMIAVNAIEKNGKIEAESLKDAIGKTEYSGASGKITFDDTGEPKKPINVDIVKDGKYVSVFTKK
ncbi:MAG: ABC transporter substrate-binding protein [Firmicutes bacterium]|nr:ABC transporter substrate-binding protein [Bacillota bacterium]